MNDAITAAHAAYREAVAAARAAEETKAQATAALAAAVEAAKAPASPLILEFERRAIDHRGYTDTTLGWCQWRLSMDDVAEFLNVEVAEVEKWDEDRWDAAADALDTVNDGDASYLTESLTSPVPFDAREHTSAFWARAYYSPVPDDES